MRRLALLILILGLTGLLVISASQNHEGGDAIAGLSQHDVASLLAKILALVLIGGAVIAVFREFSQAIEALFIWVMIGLALFLGYTYRHELSDTGNKMLAQLMPGRAYSRGRTVELARAQAGDFQIATSVNGKKVPMVLDTGASSVILTDDAAKAAGLPLEMVKYSISIDTANGRTRAAAVTLDRLAIGNIVERSVPALIAQPGQLKTSLLGMSFLNRLESWEVRGDRLLLRGYP
jgi:aspartyl protease family protein